MYGCEFCIRLALGAEYIGICHFSWFLYFMVSRLTCRSVLKVQKVIDSQSRDDIALTECPDSPTTKNRGPDFDNGVPKVLPKLSLFCYHILILSQ